MTSNLSDYEDLNQRVQESVYNYLYTTTVKKYRKNYGHNHKKVIMTDIKYWKSKTRQEIDFVVIRNNEITVYKAK